MKILKTFHHERLEYIEIKYMDKYPAFLLTGSEVFCSCYMRHTRKQTKKRIK